MGKSKNLLLLLALSLMFPLAGCNNSETSETSKQEEIVLHTASDKLDYQIDIYSTMFIAIDLDETILETNVPNISYAVAAQESGISLSAVQEDTHVVNVFSGGVTGNYHINVQAFVNEVEKLSYTLNISVVDNAPAPTKIKDVQDFSVDAPVFPRKETTSVSYSIDLKEYIDASDYVTYELENATESGVSMEVSETKIATIKFTKFGENNVKINAIFKEETAVTLDFTATVNKSITNDLYNGDFEQGYDGWDLNEWDKLSYSIYDSDYDIWGNIILNSGKYLYGYTNENGKVDFTSSLFKVAGSHYITLKIAGNCTDELYISLMKYNESGEDEEIAKLNNWYYGKYAASGFIFRDYYYQIPAQYDLSKCYFAIHDGEDAACEGGFGFINLDQIVTYYSKTPAGLDDMYLAGFKVDPNPSIELDMSDTSKDPFNATDVPYQLPNGDFENGFDHWFMTTEDKEAYTIYNSKTDIWQNKVNATGYYLYGYQKENYTGTFHSDLFKVGGCGFMTFKIAGNNTTDIQFRLKKYNPTGDDVEIDKFNNTYFQFGTRDHSGFIFHEYYYQIDLAQYEGAYCYFEVYDARTMDFGFICLDDIITYYETKPTIQEEWLKASYVNEAE